MYEPEKADESREQVEDIEQIYRFLVHERDGLQRKLKKASDPPGHDKCALKPSHFLEA